MLSRKDTVRYEQLSKGQGEEEEPTPYRNFQRGSNRLLEIIALFGALFVGVGTGILLSHIAFSSKNGEPWCK